MAAKDKQKQSLYFPDDMLREIMRESVRLDRSLSWTVQHAWRLAREELARFPSTIRGEPAAERASRFERAPDAESRRPSPQVLEFLKGKFDRELSA
jgi:uncharacterized small protein (TIGR04563 family)